MQRLASWMMRHRSLTWAVCTLITAIATVGFFFGKQRQLVRQDEDYRDVELMDSIERDFFVQETDAILVIEVDDFFSPEGVTATRKVIDAVAQLEYVSDLTWIDSVQTMNVFGLADPMLPPNNASEEKFRIAQQRVLAHPLIRGQLIDPTGKTLIALVNFDWFLVEQNADCLDRVLEAARSVAGPGMRIRITGRVPLFVASDEAFQRNKRFFQIMSHILIVVVATVVFRCLSAIIVIGAAPVIAIYWTTGILKFIQDEANPLTDAILPMLISMVALTDGVHLMVHLRRRRIAGDSPVAAAESAVKSVGQACALTSLTTAIGFASLMLGQSAFVRGFGQSCAIGVGFGFFAVLTIIPLLACTRLGNTIHHGQERDWIGKRVERSSWLMDWIVARARGVSLFGVALTVVLVWIAMSLKPDDRTYDSQPTSSEAYAALMHCDDVLGGVNTVRVVVEWPKDLTHTDPRIVDAVQSVESLIEQESLLTFSISLTSVLSAFPGDTDVRDRLAFVDLMPLTLRDALFNETTRQTLVTVRLRDMGIAKYRPVFDRLESEFDRLREKHSGFDFALTGRPVIRGRRLHQLVEDLARSLGAASVVIFVVMTLVYGSLRIGLITIVPNMFPLVVTAAILRLTDRPLDIAAVCAFTVCLGIAVDDTIHYLTAFRNELVAGNDVQQAVKRAYERVGSALLMTTLILVCGFGIVIFSELPRQRDFSMMACVTITAALVGDLIFLPALLAWGKKA